VFFQEERFYHQYDKSSPDTSSEQEEIKNGEWILSEYGTDQCNQERGWCMQGYPLLQKLQLHELESVVFYTMYGGEHIQKNPFHFKDLPGLFLALFLLAFSLTIRPDFVWDLSTPFRLGLRRLALFRDALYFLRFEVA